MRTDDIEIIGDFDAAGEGERCPISDKRRYTGIMKGKNTGALTPAEDVVPQSMPSVGKERPERLVIPETLVPKSAWHGFYGV
ncbi:hypothetical protein A2973_02480 [Candidatus Gottesmanbacteria bacterium RIFCSPLOWO2_01_FULL_49_10]|uniref:Uncharacterized protein n=1 Tax=Candidatus Gottesmanbacteria bacterium RIFCSPLOWO2_01_FULL_49_10 TaxID=1798396 RepID=A0A1F6AZG2_9BACT|nr:MAG: hypothetical protein A2973_02480 [Candidatus Gottesmanbacteria bacterium RIFCSPLOWO2_01_FULL_49_10]